MNDADSYSPIKDSLSGSTTNVNTIDAQGSVRCCVQDRVEVGKAHSSFF